MTIEIRSGRKTSDKVPLDMPSRAAKVQGRKDAKARVRRSALPVRRQSWYVACKGALDFLAAALLLLPALPLIGLAALLVKLTSRGPAFYTQRRVGHGGRIFTIYKVRTMIHNCESLTGPRWSIPGDPRITFIGQFLRVSHLDELPQLFNVLCGEMSLIGPRPERPEFLPELETAYPCYRERLAMRPGVTGLAQVRQPADTDLESVRSKLAYDLYYIQQVSPWLDLRILICTALYAFGVPFRWSRRLFRIPDRETVADLVEVPPALENVARYRKSA
jgi:lipopolysaccharide/colanic/teichoic acid biosynthesis glycosyltransferase